MDEVNENREKVENFTLMHFLVRLVSGAIVLAITAFLTPGFTISGLVPLIFAAVILALLDYIVLKFLGANATPFGRGITGFLLAAVIIYLTKFLVVGYDVTLLGAILAALVYGIVDMIVPGRAM
jgi:putative membrane protein